MKKIIIALTFIVFIVLGSLLVVSLNKTNDSPVPLPDVQTNHKINVNDFFIKEKKGTNNEEIFITISATNVVINSIKINDIQYLISEFVQSVQNESDNSYTLLIKKEINIETFDENEYRISNINYTVVDSGEKESKNVSLDFNKTTTYQKESKIKFLSFEANLNENNDIIYKITFENPYLLDIKPLFEISFDSIMNLVCREQIDEQLIMYYEADETPLGDVLVTLESCSYIRGNELFKIEINKSLNVYYSDIHLEKEDFTINFKEQNVNVSESQIEKINVLVNETEITLLKENGFKFDYNWLNGINKIEILSFECCFLDKIVLIPLSSSCVYEYEYISTNLQNIEAIFEKQKMYCGEEIGFKIKDLSSLNIDSLVITLYDNNDNQYIIEKNGDELTLNDDDVCFTIGYSAFEEKMISNLQIGNIKINYFDDFETKRTVNCSSTSSLKVYQLPQVVDLKFNNYDTSSSKKTVSIYFDKTFNPELLKEIKINNITATDLSNTLSENLSLDCVVDFTTLTKGESIINLSILLEFGECITFTKNIIIEEPFKISDVFVGKLYTSDMIPYSCLQIRFEYISDIENISGVKIKVKTTDNSLYYIDVRDIILIDDLLIQIDILPHMISYNDESISEISLIHLVYEGDIFDQTYLIKC